MNIEDILFKLLTSNSSSWSLDKEVSEFIAESEINKTPQKKIIRDIQYWLVHNKLTRTRARFLEKYRPSCGNDLRRYLGLAWSVLFFEGIKLNEYTKENIKVTQQKKKVKIKRNEFNDTLNRIKRKDKLTNKDMLERVTLLRKLIKANKIQTFKYYGSLKNEWTVNNVNYNFLRRETPNIANILSIKNMPNKV